MPAAARSGAGQSLEHWDSIVVSQDSGRDPSTWAINSAPPGTHQQEAAITSGVQIPTRHSDVESRQLQPSQNGCSHWTFLLTLFLKIENLRLSGSDYKGIVYFRLQRRKKTTGNIFSFLFCLFFRPHCLCGAACRCSPSPLIIPEVWRTRLFLSSAGVCEKLILCFSTVIQMLRLQAGG